MLEEDLTVGLKTESGGSPGLGPGARWTLSLELESVETLIMGRTEQTAPPGLDTDACASPPREARARSVRVVLPSEARSAGGDAELESLSQSR